ncbi:MAG: hypothetical protein WDZ77_00340 [Candidatus Pacearchaeota archaeon]
MEYLIGCYHSHSKRQFYPMTVGLSGVALGNMIIELKGGLK